MAIKNPELINGEIYHIILRGAGDSVIFNDINDYYRGVFSIYEFNNLASVSVWLRRQQRHKEKVLQGQTLQYSLVDDRRDKLVEVLAFCFMPNHIHLLVRQTKDKGITQFMKKIGTGYALYFNKKNKRIGHLFQGRFKAVHIKDEEQLKTVFVYIHTNPISLIEPGWKEKGVKNVGKTLEFLENSKFSSYQDYIGKSNFSSVTDRKFISDLMGGASGCKSFIKNWVEFKKECR